MTTVAHTDAVTPSMAFFPQHQLVGTIENAHTASASCDACVLHGVCMPEDLLASTHQELARLLQRPRRLRARQALFRAGEPFHALYIVKTGALKTEVMTDDGREQVTGFHFAGDVLGLDAVGSLAHPSAATAFEEVQVCAIPFALFTRASQRSEPLRAYLHRLLAREVVRDQHLMLVLGRMHADERVATFLLHTSQRFKARGYSPLEFALPMAREDIGNYLGLTLETVSRCFSRLKTAGVIEVDNRHIRISHIDSLRQVAGHNNGKQ